MDLVHVKAEGNDADLLLLKREFTENHVPITRLTQSSASAQCWEQKEWVVNIKSEPEDRVYTTNSTQSALPSADPLTGEFQNYEVKIEYEEPTEICTGNSSINSETKYSATTSATVDCDINGVPPDFDIDISDPDIKKEYVESTQTTIDDKYEAKGATYCVHEAIIKPGKSKLRGRPKNLNKNDVFHFCKECNYSTRHRSHYVSHLLVHSKNKPFSCGKCDYTSRYLVNLKRHALNHSANDIYSCAQCDFTCRHPARLKAHALVHSDEKPFSCRDCNYTCKRLNQLKIHALIHSNEKPFSCGKCDFTCRRAGELKLHALNHSDEKPFSCNNCNHNFKRLCRLKLHILTHTNKKPFSCTECDYTCIQRRQLKQHSLRHTCEMKRPSI